MSQKAKVINLYKTLLSLGKHYMHGYEHFRRTLRESFKVNKDIKDPLEINLLIAYGEYMLLHLGKDYPQGYDYFRVRLHNAFMKNSKETDPEKIDKMINHGQYIIKELEALYMLKKYRTLKRRYYN